MEGIVGGLLGGLGRGIGRKSVVPTQNAFPRDLVIQDGDAAYDTEAEIVAIIGALAAGSVDTLIWQMTVPAQQAYRWGYGSPATPQNQGYMFFVSMDEGTGFQVGIVTLKIANARETKSFKVKELNDTRLHGTTVTTTETATPVNKNEMIALPEQVQFPKVGEDSLLQVFYRCTVVATAEDAFAMSLPATVYQ
jgi:hypothetical protein